LIELNVLSLQKQNNNNMKVLYCPLCSSDQVKIIDHQPLATNDGQMPIDTEIYVSLHCDYCGGNSNTVGDITYRQPKQKVQDFNDAYKGALNGYVLLAELMNGDMVIEREITLEDFGDETFKVKCFNSIAIAYNPKRNVILRYPPKENLDETLLQQCLDYRGLSAFKATNFATYGDIMMKFGKPIFIHNKL